MKIFTGERTEGGKQDIKKDGGKTERSAMDTVTEKQKHTKD